MKIYLLIDVKCMKLNKILIIAFFIIFFSTNIFSLKMLEPEYMNIDNISEVDLGYFSSDESFLISFLLEGNEDYDSIRIMDSQKNDFIIEKTSKTQESIFTSLKLNKELSGEYILNLVISSNNMQKNIALKLNITNNVIHTKIENINQKVRYNKQEIIDVIVFNKSNTTKKISINSNLPDSWFLKNQNKIKYATLEPNSKTIIQYNYKPKEIGNKKFKIKINKVIEKNKIKSLSKNKKTKYKIKKKYNLTKLPLTSDITLALNIKKPTKTFITKPARTLSGVTIIAVMTKPEECPGNCMFCPNYKNAPKSYTGFEPAAMRGKLNQYNQ